MKAVRKLLLCGAGAAVLSAAQAQATNNCNFVQTTKSWTLQGSCSTDATIVVPNNITLNGQGFKITAIDPPGGNFTGAILQNAGKVMNVTNLFLRTNLADVCNADADKIVGILVNRGAANISSVNVTMNKGGGTSVCREGVAVQVQAVPFDPKAPYTKASVKTSTLNYNQLAGVVAVGNVNVRVEANLIKNLDGFAIGQRGIELSLGAKGYVLNNEILRHRNNVDAANDPSYGILLNAPGSSITLLTNTLNFNDAGIRVSGGTKITVRGNLIRSSTYDGILLDDANLIPTTANTLWANDSGKNGRHGIYLHSAAGVQTKNVVKNNLTERNAGSGIYVEGTLNKMQTNTATLNTVQDITNTALGNLYSKNVCLTSSGPPVNCPTAP